MIVSKKSAFEAKQPSNVLGFLSSPPRRDISSPPSSTLTPLLPSRHRYSAQHRRPISLQDAAQTRSRVTSPRTVCALNALGQHQPAVPRELPLHSDSISSKNLAMHCSVE